MQLVLTIAFLYYIATISFHIRQDDSLRWIAASPLVYIAR